MIACSQFTISDLSFATGKVIYVDGDDVTVKTVFVCEVE